MRAEGVANEVSEERVLILAPVGQDAELASRVLEREGLQAQIAADLEILCDLLNQGAGVIVLAEEALELLSLAEFKQSLSRQPAWSDVPVILLTHAHSRGLDAREILDLLAPAGNISILERPFHAITLTSAVQVALRARKRQYQVRDLLRQQAVAVKQRDEFLSVASHELKTPLTSMRLQVQMKKRFVARGDQSVYEPVKVNALINTVDNQVTRLTRLVDDMLDISRFENGKLALSREAVDLGLLALELVTRFRDEFVAAGAEIHFESEEEVVGYWDRFRVEQVVANLLTNALRYGDHQPVNVRVERRGGQALLSVEDRGVGIAPENRERIFQRFERAVEGHSVSGLGLGLYISREIVEQHGGAIEVEGVPVRGSIFRVRLPLAEH